MLISLGILLLTCFTNLFYDQTGSKLIFMHAKQHIIIELQLIRLPVLTMPIKYITCDKPAPCKWYISFLSLLMVSLARCDDVKSIESNITQSQTEC